MDKKKMSQFFKDRAMPGNGAISTPINPLLRIAFVKI